MLLKNVKILKGENLETVDVLIENGLIKEIGSINKEGNDLKGMFLSPGFIDVHVHFREPGVSHKETIKTGSMAAAKGGYTHVCSMPNVNPVPEDKASLDVQLDIIKKDAVVEITPYGSITSDLAGEKLSNMAEMKDFVCAFTDDGVGVQEESRMREAMTVAASMGKMVVAHCEDNRFTESDNERSEYEHVKRDSRLSLETGCQYHVCHISTKESIQFVREAKQKGAKVTCEVTPHHLLLTAADVNNNTNFKMNPPLRSQQDFDACVNGLLDGTIDIIATDHAPHTESEKNVDFEDAPNGIVGLETAFGLLYKNYVLTNKITLKKLIDLMATKPSEIFNLNQGVIEVGKKANLTLIDLNKEYKINKENFVSLGKNTPFDKMDATGEVVMTIVNGKVVYNK